MTVSSQQASRQTIAPINTQQDTSGKQHSLWIGYMTGSTRLVHRGRMGAMRAIISRKGQHSQCALLDCYVQIIDTHIRWTCGVCIYILMRNSNQWLRDEIALQKREIKHHPDRTGWGYWFVMSYEVMTQITCSGRMLYIDVMILPAVFFINISQWCYNKLENSVKL